MLRERTVVSLPVPDQGSTAWLSPSAAAREAKLSAQRICQLVDSGDLVGLKTPLGRLVDRRDLERFIRSRRALRHPS